MSKTMTPRIGDLSRNSTLPPSQHRGVARHRHPQKQEAELWVQRDSVHHVVRDGLETVIDFSRRRIIEIDRRAGTYVDSSLHADIAFRHFESPNRQHIWSVLQAVDPAAVRSQRTREAQEAMDAGRPFEALLTILELSLETDIPPQELGEAVRRIADPRAAQLLSAFSRIGGGPEESKAALATIDGFREEAGRRAHVLQTFAAACHNAVGQAAEARERLISALAINPFLAGAYKDLGDLYLGEYSARKAWTCWEAARRVAPGHSMLRPVHELEKTLEGAHPEYFPRQG